MSLCKFAHSIFAPKLLYLGNTSVPTPKVNPAAPPPDAVNIDLKSAQDQARKAAKRMSFAKTVFAGNTNSGSGYQSNDGMKTILGS